jgi:hypothetical protein
LPGCAAPRSTQSRTFARTCNQPAQHREAGRFIDELKPLPTHASLVSKAPPARSGTGVPVQPRTSQCVSRQRMALPQCGTLGHHLTRLLSSTYDSAVHARRESWSQLAGGRWDWRHGWQAGRRRRHQSGQQKADWPQGL